MWSIVVGHHLVFTEISNRVAYLTQRINDLILDACFVFENKSVILQELYPFAMSRIQSLLGVEIP